MSLMKAVVRVASLRQLVLAGVLAASSVAGAGAAIAGGERATPHAAYDDEAPGDLADLSAPSDLGGISDWTRSATEADATVVDLLAYGLGRIATADVGGMSPADAASTLKAMASATLDECGTLSDPDATVRHDTSGAERAAYLSQYGRGRTLKSALETMAFAGSDAEGMRATALGAMSATGQVAEAGTSDVVEGAERMAAERHAALGEVAGLIEGYYVRHERPERDLGDVRSEVVERVIQGKAYARAADRVLTQRKVSDALRHPRLDGERARRLARAAVSADLDAQALDRIEAMLDGEANGSNLGRVRRVALASMAESKRVSEAASSEPQSTPVRAR